ncbi:MAG: 16S rRNA (guanine(966)-N(2))-methyltransferase RsmD [Candidatus Hydrogenedentes bacterium]|nr:16S rRNA (guanine(966)-N(2))-methyltransferase RsmD [Candidatus Hydrogenedentota bacterium]
MLRVIAGQAKGIRLEAPKGTRVRPTLDRVREALFSILGPDIPGCRFADLFTGTGANGIEALSRGAAAVVFVDNDPRSLECVRTNVEKARLGAQATLRRLSIPAGLRQLAANGQRFDLIFADPPFEYRDYSSLLAAVSEAELLNPEGSLVLEHAKEAEIPEKIGTLRRYRHETYGSVGLSFFT